MKNEYQKTLAIYNKIKEYSTENIIDGEIIYVNDIKHLKVNYKDKESLFIDLENIL